ncbi:nicotinate phosphoribosyltransferase [Alphaproteobacteria bacterium HT1-32]|nr:nicotinate phosphoribosyltransferase [Alphaproteobacteria bacterium HT1-32]
MTFDPTHDGSHRPLEADVPSLTDKYFSRTRDAVAKFGDVSATYAIFMRRPVIFTPRLAVGWLEDMSKARGAAFDIKQNYQEGDWVGAGEPLLYLTGSLHSLVDLETILLQKLGATCIAAYNAYQMCADMPNAAFLAMDARHCAGHDMADMMAYAASVGSKVAREKHGAKGFVGNATDATAHYFGNPEGMGTMPHAFIGYAGSTLRAAEMFVETFPGKDLTVLVDYFGHEVRDALAVCNRFPEMAAEGKIGVRLDTHGSRFVEGLDPQRSYAVLDQSVPDAIRRYRSEEELRFLVGTGVSAASIFYMRKCLDDAGFDKVKVVASSGFNAAKCRVMGEVKAPIDVVGTGSYLPDRWSETYATADIISYNGDYRVKVGREFLLPEDAKNSAAD